MVAPPSPWCGVDNRAHAAHANCRTHHHHSIVPRSGMWRRRTCTATHPSSQSPDCSLPSGSLPRPLTARPTIRRPLLSSLTLRLHGCMTTVGMPSASCAPSCIPTSQGLGQRERQLQLLGRRRRRRGTRVCPGREHSVLDDTAGVHGVLQPLAWALRVHRCELVLHAPPGTHGDIDRPITQSVDQSDRRPRCDGPE